MYTSIIVLTDNRNERLERVLRALEAACSAYPLSTPREVLVLDRGDSKAATQKAMRASGITNSYWIAVEQWWNRSRCVNYGVQHCSGEEIMLLSDDCIVPENFFRAMAFNPPGGECVQAPVFTFPSGDVLAAGIGLTKKTAPSFRGHMLPPGSYTPKLRIEPLLTGVPFYCATMPRRLFEVIQGMDVSFENGIEDADFCMRALAYRDEHNVAPFKVYLRNDVKCVCEGDSTNDLVPRTTLLNDRLHSFRPFAQRWLIGEPARIDSLLCGGEVRNAGVGSVNAA